MGRQKEEKKWGETTVQVELPSALFLYKLFL